MKKSSCIDPDLGRDPGPLPSLLATAALLALVVLGTSLLVRRGPAVAPPPAVIAAARPASALEGAINSFFEGLAAWLTAVVVFAAFLLVLVVYGHGWTALLLLSDAGEQVERLMALVLAFR